MREASARRSRRAGDTLWILLMVLIVLFILGMTVAWLYKQQVRELSRHGKKIQAHHLALSGLERSFYKVGDILSQDLVTVTTSTFKEEMVINQELLNFLDAEKAKSWSRVYEYKPPDAPEGGFVQVRMELLDVVRNPFFAYIDRVEKIPPALEAYREKRDEEDNPVSGAQPLGGWSGKLKAVSRAQFMGQAAVVEAMKSIQVIDISPPAPDHTLFIHGKRTEYLKRGTFVLSNLNLPGQVLELIHQLTLKLNEVLKIPEVSAEKGAVLNNVELISKRLIQAQGDGENEDTLKLAYTLAQHTSDEAIKDTVDNIILSLNPRDWGRVRTNGVLQIYLPFFAPDDIINYFADTTIFGHSRPEIGYFNCYNRLHDSYLSVYTHYEGYIYKNYRRLNPLVLGPSNQAQVVPPQRYTINTRMNYVLRYPEREEVPNLARLRESSVKFCQMLYKKNTKLIGTEKNPLKLQGLWHAREDVSIGGPYTGTGLIVSERNIVITDDLKPLKEGKDGLGLVSLGGTIELGKKVGRSFVTAALYARDGLKGTSTNGITLLGNLSCENLNRQSMPPIFYCRFDPSIKNHMVDNINGTISKRYLSFKILSDQETFSVLP